MSNSAAAHHVCGVCAAHNATQHVQGTHIMLTNQDWEGPFPGPAEDMFSCFTSNNASRLAQPREDLRNKVVLIRRAAAGVGPKCLSPDFCKPEMGAGPPEPEEMLSWQRRASSCFGVPAMSRIEAMPKARIGIVERPAGKVSNTPNPHPFLQLCVFKLLLPLSLHLHLMPPSA